MIAMWAIQAIRNVVDLPTLYPFEALTVLHPAGMRLLCMSIILMTIPDPSIFGHATEYLRVYDA